MAQSRYGHRLLKNDGVVRITAGGATSTRPSATLAVFGVVWPIVVGTIAGMWLGHSNEEGFLVAFLVSAVLTMIRKVV